MHQICLAAENERIAQISKHRVECEFTRIDEAVAMATMYSANHIKVKAIVALTESGATTLMMSRIRSGIPIYGVSRNKKARAKMTLYRGVYPIAFDITKHERWEVIESVIIGTLLEQNVVEFSDKVILTRGDVLGTPGLSNTMKIIEVT